MNEKMQQILKLCLDRPRTARELVVETGELRTTTSTRLHSLEKIGALKKTRPEKSKVFVYQTAPGWKNPAKQYEWPQAYKPLGICVWGVWM